MSESLGGCSDPLLTCGLVSQGRIAKIWPYYFTFEGFVIPEKLITEETFYLQWMQVIEFGAANNVGVQSFCMGPIKVGTQVSTKLVDAKVKGYTLR